MKRIESHHSVIPHSTGHCNTGAVVRHGGSAGAEEYVFRLIDMVVRLRRYICAVRSGWSGKQTGGEVWFGERGRGSYGICILRRVTIFVDITNTLTFFCVVIPSNTSSSQTPPSRKPKSSNLNVPQPRSVICALLFQVSAISSLSFLTLRTGV